MKDEYTLKLENVIEQMLQPLKNIPLSLVVSVISKYKVIPFNPNNTKDKKVLNMEKQVADIGGKEFNKKHITSNRVNEIGNHIEKFVKDALNKCNYKADVPMTKNGKKKATGYPDIQFKDEFNRINYLECKTYNINNIGTTQRSFYLSPSENFKITCNAHHFVLSYEIFVFKNKNGRNIYKCKSWKILSIENLEVDVKYEFNSDNKRLYSKNLLLAEGEIK